MTQTSEMPAKTILIIEDNEQSLYLAQYLLERSGFRVAVARTGKDGIALAGKLLPSAILLDIQLPEMDGYTVAEVLQRNPALENTPIIAVTSYAMPGDRERILNAGASDYIEKPINPQTFVSQILRHLS